MGEAAIFAALGELLGGFLDVTELTKEGAAYFEKRRSEEWADAASILLFTPRGSRRPLGRIAAGKATEADFDDLQNALAFSQRKVEESISTLAQLDTDDVRKRYGLAAQVKLDEILHGELGKRQTRELLWEIARERENSSRTQQKAQQALQNIASLNRSVVELHDLIVLSKS